MPKTSIATQVHEPFDVHGYFRAQFTFYLMFTIDDLADVVDLSL
jgi:hypothetical protein